MKNKLFTIALSATLLASLTIMPVQTRAAAKEFSDVPKTYVYHDIISQMAEKGIIRGYEDGTFKPSKQVTRAQVAAMLNRSLDLNRIRPGVEFKDVTESNSYYHDIQAVYGAGIFDGTDGNFKPFEPLTRAQMAKVLVLAFGLKDKSDKQFDDMTNHWANDYVKTLFNYDITTGVTTNEYQPNTAVKRANYAVFLHRALNATKQEPQPPVVVPPVESNTTVDTPIKDFNEAIKNDPVYELENGGAIEDTYAIVPFRKLITEGRDVVASHGFKFKDVGGALVISQPNATKTQILIDGISAENLNFKIDFRNTEVVNLTRELMKIAYPEIDIDSIIVQRAFEAKNAYEKEKNVPVAQREFQGNSSFVNNAGYKIKVGTNVYLEFFWIEVKK